MADTRKIHRTGSGGDTLARQPACEVIWYNYSMQFLKKVGPTVVACLAVAFGTFIWTLDRVGAKPEVPLTAGLPAGWEAKDAELDRRVKAAFLVGSSEEQMTAELRRQSFERADWNTSSGQEYEAVRKTFNSVCSNSIHIYWQVDGEGRLTSIRGKYPRSACL